MAAVRAKRLSLSLSENYSQVRVLCNIIAKRYSSHFNYVPDAEAPIAGKYIKAILRPQY